MFIYSVCCIFCVLCSSGYSAPPLCLFILSYLQVPLPSGGGGGGRGERGGGAAERRGVEEGADTEAWEIVVVSRYVPQITY